MKLNINGETRVVSDGISLSQLLSELNYNASGNAMAINKNFIPKSQYSETPLHENDHIEIVVPMQGG